MSTETPAERGLRLMRERPDILDSIAGNLYRAETGDTDWSELPEYERAVWREKALEQQQDFATLPQSVQGVVNKVQLDDAVRENDATFDRLNRDIIDGMEAP